MDALVAHRIHDFAPVAARLVGEDVLISDQIYYRHAGPRRYFWLLDQDLQFIYEPFGWRAEWYVDIVRFEPSRQSGTPLFTVHDMYIDIVVEGMGPTYRMIDLDEAVTALAAGEVSLEQFADAVRAAQSFVDGALHRGSVFPPPRLAELFHPGHLYPHWSHDPVTLGAEAPGSQPPLP